jgi:5'-nucleotidase/2',3'-cyclic-nucleotide 2'-phosphodiesterase/3'-nucleotidase/5'-nucleotidase
VPVGSTFYPYVTCLVTNGIAGGYPDGTFRPNNNVTRGQAAKIVANAGGYHDRIPVARQTFRDVPNTQPIWLYIERMAQRHLISGYPDGTFRPTANLTRGQAAKIVSNTLLPACAATTSDKP